MALHQRGQADQWTGVSLPKVNFSCLSQPADYLDFYRTNPGRGSGSHQYAYCGALCADLKRTPGGLFESQITFTHFDDANLSELRYHRGLFFDV
jgi:hypothetical protein